MNLFIMLWVFFYQITQVLYTPVEPHSDTELLLLLHVLHKKQNIFQLHII